jgi:flagellar motor switch protein FliN/FliY
VPDDRELTEEELAAAAADLFSDAPPGAEPAGPAEELFSDEPPVEDRPAGGRPGAEPSDGRASAPGSGRLSELFGERRDRGPLVTPDVRPVQFVPLAPEPKAGEAPSLDLLMDVTLQISVELGRTRLTVKDVLALRPGSVLELDKTTSEPVDVLVNGTLVARGEVVVVDEKFGIRITEVLSKAKRLSAVA